MGESLILKDLCLAANVLSVSAAKEGEKADAANNRLFFFREGFQSLPKVIAKHFSGLKWKNIRSKKTSVVKLSSFFLKTNFNSFYFSV